MPPPPPKLLKAIDAEREQQIEQLLTECSFVETLEVFRAERAKRARLASEPTDNVSLIEKRGENWICTFCDKTFTTKGSAKRHLVSTHSLDSKQFECPKCTSKFARRDDLYTHLRRMHDAADLVESMIEEHKAELKGEHKGLGLGLLFNVVSHQEHLDVVLPSGNTICRPFATDVSSLAAREPSRAARMCRTAKCNHWRVTHDDHEDVLVNGSLHHKNEEGEWECHGEIGSVEDFEFLVSNARSCDLNDAPLIQVSGQGQTHAHPCSASSSSLHEHSSPALHPAQVFPGHHHHAQGSHDAVSDLCFEDLDFFLSEPSHSLPVGPPPVTKSSVESLLLPDGSVFRHRLTPSTSKYHYLTSDTHRHSPHCGHSRMRHGNHYDYIVGNVVESESLECPMNGVLMLEPADASSLDHIISALSKEQQQQGSAQSTSEAAAAT